MSYTDTVRSVRFSLPPIHSSTVYRFVWALALVAALGDILTTTVGLHLGLSESNPVARGSIELLGIAGLTGLKLAAVVIGLACVPFVPRTYRVIIPAGLALPWVLAIGINTYMILTVV